MSAAQRNAAAPRTTLDTAEVAVTGWNVHLPGPGAEGPDLAWLLPGGAVPAERAHELLGRKGLLAKEPATRLALCSVHQAVGGPAPSTPHPPIDRRTAVITASNTGNLDAIVRIARTVRDRGGAAVSPLDAPNASSNVIASTVAIRFRWGAPNIMVTSGATAGLDALAIGADLLAAGRADRVVVVGVEPDDDVATAVRSARRRDGRRPRAVAATVILERPAGTAVARRSPTLGSIAFHPPGGSPALPPSLAGVHVAPAGVVAGARRIVDVERAIGDAYGALGVLQVAIAARLLDGRPGVASVAVACGDREDGWRSATVRGGATVKEAA